MSDHGFSTLPGQEVALPGWRESVILEHWSFLKSAWRHSVYYYYDKARNTPYFPSWHLGDSLGVYRWPQCRYKRRFYKSHSRLSKITTGNRCRNIRTMQNVTNRNLIDPNKSGTWGLKIGFFVGNAGKSRGRSPRNLCHVIRSPDDRLRKWFERIIF